MHLVGTSGDRWPFEPVKAMADFWSCNYYESTRDVIDENVRTGWRWEALSGEEGMGDWGWVLWVGAKEGVRVFPPGGGGTFHFQYHKHRKLVFVCRLFPGGGLDKVPNPCSPPSMHHPPWQALVPPASALHFRCQKLPSFLRSSLSVLSGRSRVAHVPAVLRNSSTEPEPIPSMDACPWMAHN